MAAFFNSFSQWTSSVVAWTEDGKVKKKAEQEDDGDGDVGWSNYAGEWWEKWRKIVGKWLIKTKDHWTLGEKHRKASANFAQWENMLWKSRLLASPGVEQLKLSLARVCALAKNAFMKELCFLQRRKFSFFFFSQFCRERERFWRERAGECICFFFAVCWYLPAFRLYTFVCFCLCFVLRRRRRQAGAEESPISTKAPSTLLIQLLFTNKLSIFELALICDT